MDLASNQSFKGALRRVYICEHCGAKIRYHWLPDVIFGLSMLYILIPVYFENKHGTNTLVISLFVICFCLMLLQFWVSRKLHDKMARIEN